MSKLSITELGKIVKEKREKRDLTQQDLSELTGINRQMIGRIETGAHLPSLPQLNALLDTLEISYEQLLVDKKEEDVFVAFLGNATTPAEKEGFQKMISMMLCLSKHLRLREAYNDK
ncbi:hypothetical protein ICW_01915 [Bacillus wiedmannii]|uniref:helix-turn-helix domain-containing protein n=1 Tax=Bacillus wiedmannii TaxID=1890302 RepID=UPI00027AA583|nr:helix-turn-helix transcriptional regulator [Bacillus wiedmannii]EJS70446.1 hypothetical protein ICW_01915 [Bacillus wiedmannii]